MEPNAASRLAKELMTEHGLTNWQFKFDRSVKRFGYCQGYVYGGVISLSLPLTVANTETEVRSTLLHEIAHALAPSGEHHGPTWQAICLRIGGDGRRCYDNDVVIQQPAPWIGICLTCGQKLERFRRRKIACGRCCNEYNDGRYTEAYLIVWHRA